MRLFRWLFLSRLDGRFRAVSLRITFEEWHRLKKKDYFPIFLLVYIPDTGMAFSTQGAAGWLLPRWMARFSGSCIEMDADGRWLRQ